jgi:ABC-type Fe3+ transport system permease subunit
MFGRILEIALVALLAIFLVALVLRRAVRNRHDTADIPLGDDSPVERDDARLRWAGWAEGISGTLFAVAILNFLAFSVHTGRLGGSADHTKNADGHYFVSTHGTFTEVTEEQWHAVRMHGISVNITHPLGILVGGFLVITSQRRRERMESDPGA